MITPHVFWISFLSPGGEEICARMPTEFVPQWDWEANEMVIVNDDLIVYTADRTVTASGIALFAQPDSAVALYRGDMLPATMLVDDTLTIHPGCYVRRINRV